MASKTFPILFIAKTGIGDAVMASGLVKSLSEEVPLARFTIVGGELTAPLFADTPALDRLVVQDDKRGAGSWFSLWRRVRGRWGLVVDLRGSTIAGALKPRRRAVHQPGAEPAHKVVEAARLLKLEDDPPAPYLFTGPATEARAEVLTRGRGPILAMAPGANWIGKTWPAERFALVVRRLLAPDGPLAGGRLMIVGGPEDQASTEALRSAVDRDHLIDLVNREPLLTRYAALKHARLFIGNATGMMHLAAAAGAPTIGLFGPTDEGVYAPWGPHTRVVRGSRPFEQIRAMDPEMNQRICHMMDLSADSVLAAARDLLVRTEAGAAVG